MRETPYYSIRTGAHPGVPFNLAMLRRMVSGVYRVFESRGYFQEAFGYYCVDAGSVPGSLGFDIEAVVTLRLHKPSLWPITSQCEHYSEDDVFDIVEFLFDHVSKPLEGYHHTYNGCGWHYHTFDPSQGREEYRLAINRVLRHYGKGFELTPAGEVHSLVSNEMAPLFDAPVPEYDVDRVSSKVQAAKAKFTRRHASDEDKHDAIRDLAAVLEYLRDKARDVITSKDEDDLFVLANKFGIRHNDTRQKVNYDKSIWFDWMFFYYLNTILTVLRLLARAESAGAPEDDLDDLPF